MLNHMVADQALDRVFHALAHPARRRILRELARGERTLTELGAPFRMSFPAVSKHVRVLERARLVKRRVVGRTHPCHLDATLLHHASRWTEQFRRNWEARFQALDSLLDQMKRDQR